jgi:hypothetical protein
MDIIDMMNEKVLCDPYNQCQPQGVSMGPLELCTVTIITAPT